MISALLGLIAFLSLVVAGLAWTAHVRATHFQSVEDRWRERERQLIDRLLKQAQVPPLEIQRERVLKLPDPELTPTAETWVDAAMREDDVMEEIEYLFPEAARLGPTLAKERYAQDWKRIEKRIIEQRTPLRMG